MLGLKVYLSEDLEKKFRRIAMNVYGYGRGSLSKAAEEAISRWCSNNESPSLSNTHGHASKSVAKKGILESPLDPDERKATKSSDTEGRDSPPA